MIEAIIFSIIQALTEFLPISSSGHLTLLPSLFGLEGALWTHGAHQFLIAVHAGTAAALVVYNWRTWTNLTASASLRAVRKQWSAPSIHLLVVLICGCAPIVIAGIILQDWVESFFQGGTLSAAAFWTIIGAFILISLLMIIVERWRGQHCSLRPLRWRHGLLIGLAQILALVPGTSRSGITMITGMTLKIPRIDAARLSFLMAAPLFAGVLIYNILQLIYTADPTEMENTITMLPLFLSGLLTSFIAGLIIIHLFMWYIGHKTLTLFAIYRIAFALFAIAIYYT